MANADNLVEGIIQLFQNCPSELVNIRKELLAISRHIISDLRQSKIRIINLKNDIFSILLFFKLLFSRIHALYYKIF